MERLTYFNEAYGAYRLRPVTYTEDAIQRLALYENLGTPEELRNMKEQLKTIKYELGLEEV